MMETYTIIEVAEMLKISKRTILRYINTGELKALKLGNSYRITKESLEKFVASHTLKSE